MINLSALILVMNIQALPPSIEFTDSHDDSRYTFVTVEHDFKTCKIKILKADLKDYDRVIAVVMEKCGL